MEPVSVAQYDLIWMVIAGACFVLALIGLSLYFRLSRQARFQEQQLNDQLRQSELRQQEMQLQNKHFQDKLNELSMALHESRSLSETLSTQLNQAERSREVALSQYQQSLQNLTDLQARLNQNQEELKSERVSRSQLQDRLAALDKQARALEVKTEETDSKYRELREAFERLQTRHDAKQEDYHQLKTEFTRLQTELEERQAGHTRQLSQFEEQKKALSEQFKLLANDILESKAKALQETNQLSLKSVISPFQQSIDSFKKEVQEIHHRETTQQGELRKELLSLKELNQQITAEAHELSTALKGQKKLQGNWGELVLENVLDRSGLQLGKDYKREVSITTEEGRQRPDAIVYLPQDKHLIIDAKVSLNAYTRYVNSEDEVERKQALNEHVTAMGQRISELADRDYYKLPGLNSPEMVFMFVPIESAFVEALKADETLFQKAIENNVLVATPTTLLTSLNIVRQLWRYEDQNKHTVALATKAEQVFKKLNVFLGTFENIKKGLEKATEAYVKAEGQLVSGKGNLVKQVGEFKNLAPAIKAELPEYFTDKASLEIDFIAVDESSETSEKTLPEEDD
jgi:DNA recombination protein RmuC